VLATAMAAASAELVELPARRAKRLNRYNWQVVLVGLTASVLAAVIAVPALLSVDQKPRLIAGGTPGAGAVGAESIKLESLPSDVDWDKVKKRKGKETTCGEDDPKACILRKGSGPHVLVVGDSHGAMMADMWQALARKHDLTLSMNTVLGCPWQENLKNLQSPPDRQRQCAEARVDWYDKVLPELDPDVVVLVGHPRESEKRWGHLIEQRDGGDAPLEKATMRATRETTRTLEKRADRVLLIRELATSKFDPNDCATATDDLSRCLVPVPTEPAIVDATYIAEETENDDLYSVDLNPAFCKDGPLCEPVVDGEVAWRDKLHFTPKYVEKRADRVWERISKTGVLDGLG
jgi:hypothetical protein